MDTLQPLPEQPAKEAETEDVLTEALRLAAEAGAAVCKLSGGNLTARERRAVLAAFRRTLAPPRKRGRKQAARISRACEDWKRGTRGVRLYNAHIPGWDSMSRWRRREMERRLMAAIRTRHRRTQRANGQPIPSPIA